MNGGTATENGGEGVGSAARGASGSNANGRGAGWESGAPAPAPAQAVKAAKMPAANANKSQGKGGKKGSGQQPAPKEDPPVITANERQVLDEMVSYFRMYHQVRCMVHRMDRNALGVSLSLLWRYTWVFFSFLYLFFCFIEDLMLSCLFDPWVFFVFVFCVCFF